ncbi:MAG: acyltransferase [Clostridia bacterium]|nr:acyltransferase [Clostridia bacterium]
MIDRIKKRFQNPVDYWRSKGVKIGKNTDINRYVVFGTEPYLITIGDNVRITRDVELITHDGGVWVLRNLYSEFKDIDIFGRIVIGNNVYIGNGAIVLPGVTIGNNCIIGAGAIVTKDVPENSIVAGVPARVIETIDEYVEKNKSRFVNTKYMDSQQKKEYLISNHF